MPGAPSIDPAKAALALNLAEAGYGPSQIARKIGLNRTSVGDIIRQHGRWGEIAEKPVFVQLRQQQNQVLEAAFRAGAAKCLERAFDESKLEKGSTYQLVMSSVVAVDKARLLAGESTQNVAVAHHHDVEDLEAAASLLAASLTRFSNAVPEPPNQVIDISPEPKKIRSDENSE